MEIIKIVLLPWRFLSILLYVAHEFIKFIFCSQLCVHKLTSLDEKIYGEWNLLEDWRVNKYNNKFNLGENIRHRWLCQIKAGKLLLHTEENLSYAQDNDIISFFILVGIMLLIMMIIFHSIHKAIQKIDWN